MSRNLHSANSAALMCQHLVNRLAELDMLDSELAEIVGVTPTTVWRWVHGRARIPNAVFCVLDCMLVMRNVGGRHRPDWFNDWMKHAQATLPPDFDSRRNEYFGTGRPKL